jgi:hypothetical protein
MATERRERKRKPYVPLPGKGMKVRAGFVGDINSDDGFGWYRFEWAFPRIDVRPGSFHGAALSDWVQSRHKEARNWLDDEATRYGLTSDEFLSTLTYEVDADGTNEVKADGSPDWSHARHGLPFFSQRNPNAQRMDLVLKELMSKVETIGDNDLVALKIDSKWLKKYDFKYIRCKTLILRFHTEDFAELASKSNKIHLMRGYLTQSQEEREAEIAAIRKRNSRNERRRELAKEKREKKAANLLKRQIKRKLEQIRIEMSKRKGKHPRSWLGSGLQQANKAKQTKKPKSKRKPTGKKRR